MNASPVVFTTGVSLQDPPLATANTVDCPTGLPGKLFVNVTSNDAPTERTLEIDAFLGGPSVVAEIPSEHADPKEFVAMTKH